MCPQCSVWMCKPQWKQDEVSLKLWSVGTSGWISFVGSVNKIPFLKG